MSLFGDHGCRSLCYLAGNARMGLEMEGEVEGGQGGCMFGLSVDLCRRMRKQCSRCVSVRVDTGAVWSSGLGRARIDLHICIKHDQSGFKPLIGYRSLKNASGTQLVNN